MALSSVTFSAIVVLVVCARKAARANWKKTNEFTEELERSSIGVGSNKLPFNRRYEDDLC